jgi:hypothetical protein
MLNHAERLLASTSPAGSESDGSTLWMVRRTKQLLASGQSFDNASAMAFAEMDQRFPKRPAE